MAFNMIHSLARFVGYDLQIYVEEYENEMFYVCGMFALLYGLYKGYEAYIIDSTVT